MGLQNIPVVGFGVSFIITSAATSSPSVASYRFLLNLSHMHCWRITIQSIFRFLGSIPSVRMSPSSVSIVTNVLQWEGENQRNMKKNKQYAQRLGAHHRFYDVCFRKTCMACKPFLSTRDMGSCQKLAGAKQKGYLTVLRTYKSCVSLYLFTHPWAYGHKRKISFYWLFQRGLSYQYFIACGDGNMHSSHPPSSSLLQQWKM